MYDNLSAVHSGNYYGSGVQRVIAKLNDMGIAVPREALENPPIESELESLGQFPRIEHAMLDWFEGRDYIQAQALIHFRPPRNNWHVIRAVDVESLPGEVSDGMLCPSLLDALGAVIEGCDSDVSRLDECRVAGAVTEVIINGQTALTIEPIRLEPFNLANRERVRSAFKGVRLQDSQTLMSFAMRLPGFKGVEVEPSVPYARTNTEMFLGFPGNWAKAMRGALSQVGIEAKQSQAQELAAVFFGASDWHQLVKHQDEPNDGTPPVAVRVKLGEAWTWRYYHTPEEAILATAIAVSTYPEPVVIQKLGQSTSKDRATVFATTKREWMSMESGRGFYCESCIECGVDDYWDLASEGSIELKDSAQQLLDRIRKSSGVVTSNGVLYQGDGTHALLEGIIEREGIPREQLVYVGQHACVVSYSPEPDGGPLQAARLRLFEITSAGAKPVPGGNIAMYKAAIRVIETDVGLTLEIAPDYGNGTPLRIQATNEVEVRRLLDMTNREGLFSLAPSIDFTPRPIN